MFELTLYPSLVVRRWCRAFLFDLLSMEEDCAEDVCQLADVFFASSGRAVSGVRIRYLTRVRTGPPFGWVSRMFDISRNRPTSDAELSGLRNWFSDSTSTSASPVPPGFSVTKPLTNAANTDMKGSPIWCPFCPLAASLHAFPCALAAANGWNEATSPSTSHARQKNPSSRLLDWAHCRRSSSR